MGDPEEAGRGEGGRSGGGVVMFHLVCFGGELRTSRSEVVGR